MMYVNRGVLRNHGKGCCHHINVDGLNEIIGNSLELTNDATSHPATLKGIGDKYAGGVKWKI